jgi:hypothetical protein
LSLSSSTRIISCPLTALGRAVAQRFRTASAQWTTASVDFTSNGGVDQNVLLQAGQPWEQHAEKVAQWVRAQGSSSGADPHSIAAIISVAGSWDGTAVGAPAFADSCSRMYRANVEPSLLGAILDFARQLGRFISSRKRCLLKIIFTHFVRSRIALFLYPTNLYLV